MQMQRQSVACRGTAAAPQPRMMVQQRHHVQHPQALRHSSCSTSSSSRLAVVQAQQRPADACEEQPTGRREVVGGGVAAAVLAALAQQLAGAGPAAAITGNPLEYKKELARKRRKIPEADFKDGPDGLKYYDLTVGTGAEAMVGQRVACHYDVKFRNVTFVTTRQGIGVTGGTPFGWDVGQPRNAPGSALPGIDLGVRGMRVGGQRRLIVPPSLAYGSKGVGEIPGGASLIIDLELLSIKTSPFGARVKLVEG